MSLSLTFYTLNEKKSLNALNQCYPKCGPCKLGKDLVLDWVNAMLPSSESLAIKKRKISWTKQRARGVVDLLSGSSSLCHYRLVTNRSWTGLNSSSPFTLEFIHDGSISICCSCQNFFPQPKLRQEESHYNTEVWKKRLRTWTYTEKL